MIASRRPLVRLLQSVFVGLTLLCVLAKPVLTIAHEVHEAQHAALDGSAGEAAAESHDGKTSLGHLLFAAHCCAHAPVLASDAPVLVVAHQPQAPPVFVPTPPSPSPRATMLRPPIPA